MQFRLVMGVVLIAGFASVAQAVPEAQETRPPKQSDLAPASTELPRERQADGSYKARQIAGGVSEDDYPPEAIRAYQAGTVVAEYTVAPDGKVYSCKATSDDHVAILEEATCHIIIQRFEYEPALDAHRKPIAEDRTQRVIWRLPESYPVGFVPYSIETSFLVDADGTVSECKFTHHGDWPEKDRFCPNTTKISPILGKDGVPVPSRIIVRSSVEITPTTK